MVISREDKASLILFLFVTVERVNGGPKLISTIWDLRIDRYDIESQKQDMKKMSASYPIKDPNPKLSSSTFDVYLNWDHMPIVGFIYTNRIKIGTFTAPANYTQ